MKALAWRQIIQAGGADAPVWSMPVLRAAMALLCLLEGGQLFLPPAQAQGKRMDKLPSLFLWAWERPENFCGLDVSQAGIAFLSKTILLKADRVLVKPRLQPLVVPPTACLIAVARIETDHRQTPFLSRQQLLIAGDHIVEMAQSAKVKAVQIDFDARCLERDFYRSLLKYVRDRLPQRIGLSMTALSSWCIGDNWIKDLPVDEAVPMIFRMGADHRRILLYFQSGGSFAGGVSGGSVGISLDEPAVNKTVLPHLSASAEPLRIYVFNPSAWSNKKIREVVKETHACRKTGVCKGGQ